MKNRTGQPRTENRELRTQKKVLLFRLLGCPFSVIRSSFCKKALLHHLPRPAMCLPSITIWGPVVGLRGRSAPVHAGGREPWAPSTRRGTCLSPVPRFVSGNIHSKTPFA